MLVAQISDTHIASAAPQARSRIADLARAVRAINALDPRPEVVLHTGDIAHDGAAGDYAAARAELAKLAPPLLATIGNRDDRREFLAAFRADGYLGEGQDHVQYAVELGALRIVAADTLDDGSALGGFCAEREAGLGRLLSEPTERPTLVFLHHPPVALPDIKGPPLPFRDPARAEALTRLLAGTSSVIAVVAGHVHRSRSVPIGGTCLTTMPSIAVDLSRERLPPDKAGRPVFHLHHVTGCGVATASVVA